MAETDDDRRARMSLNSVVESGDPRIGPLVDRFGAAAVWSALRRGVGDPAWVRRAESLDLAAVQSLAERHHLRFVTPEESEWPSGLAALATCEAVQEMGGVPLGLWVRGTGDLATLAQRSVALVGSRASSPYGDRVASDLAAGLAVDGITVVSGGAYGIDAAAHRGALADGGPTVALLAGGLDAPYPRAHERLLDAVAAAGAVVSEVPPGEHPTRRRFLARNRLIAALAGGTVIVEAALRSGARNTVTWASGCGRPVMAVPGPVGSVTSYTPHRLIREGEAVLVTTVAEIRELVEPVGAVLVTHRGPRHLLDALRPEQRAVHEALPSRGSRDAGELAVRAGVPLPAALAVLDELAEAGLAESTADGGWRVGRVRDRPVSARAD